MLVLFKTNYPNEKKVIAETRKKIKMIMLYAVHQSQAK